APDGWTQPDPYSYHRLRRVDRTGCGHQPFNGVTGTHEPLTNADRILPRRHAHAGVLTLLAMLLQIAVDYAAIPSFLVWPVRVGAIAASILVSGGFFAVAHRRSLRIILYTGAVLVAATTLTVGVGLIRSR